MTQLFRLRAWFGRHPLLGLVLAAVSTLVALGLRLAVGLAVPNGFPFLTFFPAVIVTAFLAGWRAAALATLLSAVLAWAYFLPAGAGWVTDMPTAVALGLYMCVAAVFIATIQATMLAMDRLEAERRVTETLLVERNIMFQELQHRVANNMQLVSSLLGASRRRLAEHPEEAAEVIEAARIRIDTMARIHRRLYDPAAVSLPVDAYLAELCRDLVVSAGDARIGLRTDVAPMVLDIRRLLTLSLLVTELVANALKHAFPPQMEQGTIAVELIPFGEGRLRLVVSDDGRGLPDGFDPRETRRLCVRIALGLAGQLGGRLDYDTTGPGTRACVEFPARSDPSFTEARA